MPGTDLLNILHRYCTTWLYMVDNNGSMTHFKKMLLLAAQPKICYQLISVDWCDKNLGDGVDDTSTTVYCIGR